MNRIVVALGGNALARSGESPTVEAARAHIRETLRPLVELLRRGHTLVLTHGNGPQVGALLVQQELAKREIPALPMDVVGAMTQGWIGYLLQQELASSLARAHLPHAVVPLITRTEVDRRDPAFQRPSKPVGPFYSENEARLLRKSMGWAFQDDTARGGWRRIVPSPQPLHVLEADWLRQRLDDPQGGPWVPILSGGGGVPVIRAANGGWEGVEAVIDKDRSAALLAHRIGASTLAIVTDVPAAMIDSQPSHPRPLSEVSAVQLRAFLEAGQFGEGSMRPKVEAALDFVERGGPSALITDIHSLHAALAGRAGTRVRRGKEKARRSSTRSRSSR